MALIIGFIIIQGIIHMFDIILKYFINIFVGYYYSSERNMDINTIIKEKINGKSFGKLIKRFSKKYNVDPSYFPNTNKRSRLAELRFIFFVQT